MQDFDSLDPYVPVTSLEVLAEEIGVKVADLVKLDANENLYGPIPEVRHPSMGGWCGAASVRTPANIDCVAGGVGTAGVEPSQALQACIASAMKPPLRRTPVTRALQIQEAIASCDVYHIYPDPGQVRAHVQARRLVPLLHCCGRPVVAPAHLLSVVVHAPARPCRCTCARTSRPSWRLPA